MSMRHLCTHLARCEEGEMQCEVKAPVDGEALPKGLEGSPPPVEQGMLSAPAHEAHDMHMHAHGTCTCHVHMRLQHMYLGQGGCALHH